MKALVLFLLLLCFSACTVNKRLHYKGFHIQKQKVFAKKNILSEPNVKAKKVDNSLEQVPIALNDKMLNLDDFDAKENVVIIDVLSSDYEVNILNKESEWNTSKSREVGDYIIPEMSQEDDESENKQKLEKRKIPLFWFLFGVFLLMIPFTIVSIIFGVVVWALIAELLMYTLFADVLSVFLILLVLGLIYFFAFYGLFKWIYDNDDYYKNDKVKFKKDFWRISTIFFFVFLLVGLVLIFYILMNL